MTQKALKGAAKICASKTHCPKGHELKGNNLKKYELSIGKRSCRICANQRQKIRLQSPKGIEYRRKWQRANQEIVNNYSRNWRKENKEYFIQWDSNNKEKRKAINKRHNSKPERIAYLKAWNKEHPRSFTGYPFETRQAMNEKRYIQENTCQWFGCGLTYKDVPIHVHHILPKAEYPEYEMELWNLICYCGKHHLAFHEARNDPCVPLLRAQVKRELELVQKR